MNFLQRRASEEKLNMKMKQANIPPNGNSQKRVSPTNNNNIMYQEYLYQKSRSPQNINAPKQIDYYKMITTT